MQGREEWKEERRETEEGSEGRFNNSQEGEEGDGRGGGDALNDDNTEKGTKREAEAQTEE